VTPHRRAGGRPRIAEPRAAAPARVAGRGSPSRAPPLPAISLHDVLRDGDTRAASEAVRRRTDA
jgi:hypothetical protein